MTPLGDYLDFREWRPVTALLNRLPDVREAIHGLYESYPHGPVNARFEIYGRLRKGTVTVSGQLYTFLLLRHSTIKVSILTVVPGNISQADLDYFCHEFK